MKKQRLIAFLVSIIMCGLLLTGCGGDSDTADGEKVYELTFQTQYMNNHPVVENVVMPWIEEVKERSDGRLIITHYNPNTLTSVQDTYNAVLSGTLDIGSAPMSWSPGKFPLSEIVEMPFLVSNSKEGSSLLWEMYQTMPEYQKEFEESIVLWQWTSPPTEVHTKNKLVTKLEDLKGFNVIALTSFAVDIATHLGASPINMTPNDAYMSLERNMADGLFHATAPMRSLRIDEITKYHTKVGMSSTGFYTVMNKDVFNSLPEDLQQILLETTGEKLVTATAEVLDAASENDEKWMIEQGHEFYELPAEERARWIEAVSPITEKWLSNMENKGYSGLREIVERYYN
ncbi:TRAP transporter substrate-binding protein [Desulfofalx alkaliphila]|uniref:TRAP transporter substrate-binding protein n=1 Tax=Desulfofalx alkaliphila TaxID=105483 RepID=UPI0004E26F52|nr:TRAP transporter substrate-binding protein [Desulfofalx alkaliphila]